MNTATQALPDHNEATRYVTSPDTAQTEARGSGVSWAAVAAGAFAATALWVILLALGAGMGLSSVSPFGGASDRTVSFGGILFLCITEIISGGVGGYLAGRLRTKWVNLHTDEVYFRDTAHGFLAWSTGLVMAAAFLTAATAGVVGQQPASTTTDNYYTDSLFRGGHGEDTAYKTEAAAIFAHTITNRIVLRPEDKNHLADLVTTSIGIGPSEAQSRVADVFQRAQVAADEARKAAAHSLYWLFVALLLGAFTASFAATLGGRRRDHIPMHSATHAA
jgi:hypothetical protein